MIKIGKNKNNNGLFFVLHYENKAKRIKTKKKKTKQKKEKKRERKKKGDKETKTKKTYKKKTLNMTKTRHLPNGRNVDHHVGNRKVMNFVR